jgi:hypothetical protein
MHVTVKRISKTTWGLSALLVIAVVGASFQYYRTYGTSRVEAPETTPAKETVRLFFPSNSERLSSRVLDLQGSQSEKMRAEIIIGELKKEKAIPGKTRLLDLAFGEDGTLYANLSREFIEDRPKSPNEIAMVYSLINSLVSGFKNSKRVQLLVEGRALPTVDGTVYTYLPLEFNNDLVEE